MDVEIRPITPDELAAFAQTSETAFGAEPSQEQIDEAREELEFDRTLAAFDGGAIVATAAAFSFQLTLPGPAFVPAAGVTWVGVLPTHRRQGLLRRLLQRQFDDFRGRGEPLAILSASESSIYRRFGYGIATHKLRFEIEQDRAAFIQPATLEGRMHLLDRDAATALVPHVYDRVRRCYPGFVTRKDVFWRHYLRDPERLRGGMSRRFYAAYESQPGQCDGYATYRIADKWEDGFSNNVLHVMEIMAATPQAYRALWQYLFGVDLVASIQTHASPPDEPLRWMLTEPRRLRITYMNDFLWVRLLDIPAALSARRYTTDGAIVFEVVDTALPENCGCYALEVGREGAICRRTSVAPDVALDVAELGAAFLGGVRFSTLARAGMVAERRPGALQRADALFTSDPLPFCSTNF